MSEHIIKHLALKMVKYIMHCDHNNKWYKYYTIIKTQIPNYKLYAYHGLVNFRKNTVQYITTI